LQDYQAFIDKFKPKKTTDDCYTPPAVYEVVKEWAVNEYRLDGREIVRPFYPGGDYENVNYPEGCVVIDNPPFSILSKILDFYIAKNIKFFLFAPRLTLFSRNKKGACFLVTETNITYENGAKVPTSFVTNLDSHKIRTVPELQRRIQRINNVSKAQNNYTYPVELVTAAGLGTICSAGAAITLDENDVHFIRALDAQRAYKKTVFGGGFLISTEKGRAITKAAKEAKAAKVQIWELSEREKELVRGLRPSC